MTTNNTSNMKAGQSTRKKSSGATITRPKTPMEGESNTVKVSNTSEGTTATRNTPLRSSTITSDELSTAQAYDEMHRAGGSDRSPDPAFQYTWDRSNRVPQWTNESHSFDAPDQHHTGYGSDIYKQAEGYHKGPMMKEHSVADNAYVSQMFSGYDTPISSGINKAGGSIGKPSAGINKR